MAQLEKEPRNHSAAARFEERSYPMVWLNLPVEYYPVKSDGRRTGYTERAGEGGLTVYLRNPFQVGDLLKLRLFFSSGPAVNAVETLSQVVWTEKLKDAEYRCGMKFVDISAEDMNKLSSFLKKLSPSLH